MISWHRLSCGCQVQLDDGIVSGWKESCSKVRWLATFLRDTRSEDVHDRTMQQVVLHVRNDSAMHGVNVVNWL